MFFVWQSPHCSLLQDALLASRWGHLSKKRPEEIEIDVSQHFKISSFSHVWSLQSSEMKELVRDEAVKLVVLVVSALRTAA